MCITRSIASVYLLCRSAPQVTTCAEDPTAFVRSGPAGAWPELAPLLRMEVFVEGVDKPYHLHFVHSRSPLRDRRRSLDRHYNLDQQRPL